VADQEKDNEDEKKNLVVSKGEEEVKTKV